MKYSYECFICIEIYVDICKKFYFFPDEVLCKSCIYKCIEGVDRYTAFIKDCVMTEQN